MRVYSPGCFPWGGAGGGGAGGDGVLGLAGVAGGAANTCVASKPSADEEEAGVAWPWAPADPKGGTVLSGNSGGSGEGRVGRSDSLRAGGTTGAGGGSPTAAGGDCTGFAATGGFTPEGDGTVGARPGGGAPAGGAPKTTEASKTPDKVGRERGLSL